MTTLDPMAVLSSTAMLWCQDNGTTPNVTVAQLKSTLEQAGVQLVNESVFDGLDKTKLTQDIASYAQTANNQEEKDFSEAMTRAHEELSQRDEVKLGLVAVTITYSALVICLAMISKLKYKDGKWELVEGIPAIEHFPKVLKPLLEQK